jgi:hypothetical protein
VAAGAFAAPVPSLAYPGRAKAHLTNLKEVGSGRANDGFAYGGTTRNFMLAIREDRSTACA